MSDSAVLCWKEFFFELFKASEIPFSRCLTPPDAVGKPSLVLFPDGSEIAYGAAAYIRWELSDGGFWCRLIMAKSRIAPMSRINIPQMELNGSLIATRARVNLLAEMTYHFDKVI